MYQDFEDTQIIEETCNDSYGGYDYSYEEYSDNENFWDYDYYNIYEYYYIDENRNTSGRCLTDSSADIWDDCTESYQYSIEAPSQLTWADYEQCTIPPVNDGCF